ncbi:MAG: hypothetical protein K0S53_1149 [Bacteroidetes bacterium]|jgi:hypothetical protein|nr:hypothetical protein [Bacteroidota bacterium]MDF2452375.1 hypothetical protein [Bacteroidota bacterium]
MSIKEKIELLNKEINEKISNLKSVKAECESEETINGELSSETFAKKKLIESEWKKSISKYNELQGSIRK